MALPEGISITTAAVEDAERILEVQKLAYRSEAEIYGDFEIPPLAESLDEMRAEFEYQLFLKAVEDDRLVGSVRASLDGGVCRIGRLIVLPSHQNRGIGGALLSEVERRFAGAETFELFTGHLSERNLHIYRKHGYEVTGTERTSDRVRLVYLRKEASA